MKPEKEVRNPSQYKLEDFDYELPKELIATEPAAQRDACRLLIVDRKSGQLRDGVFLDVLEFMKPGDVLVMNDSKVFPARLRGQKPTGGKAEVLLVEPEDSSETVWTALTRPVLKDGQTVDLGHGLKAEVLGKNAKGYMRLAFEGANVRAFAQQYGEMPLPPYMKRAGEAKDKADYQTVYAKKEGSIAAPTAGLHFTPELLKSIQVKGVECVWTTLHVGYGTFQMVDDVESHVMHGERFELSAAAAEKINAAKKRGSKIWSVGSTSTRTLETCVVKGQVVSGEGETDLFILPPFEFEAVDGLITNFHLPKSTLLMLVGAFAGMELMKKAYAHAIREQYRFYSYGDAMLIV